MKNLSVILKNKKISLLKSDIKQIKDNQLLVKILYAGICGTDIQMINGLRPDSAEILGHEGIGKILATGKKIKNFKLGQQAIFNPVSPKNQSKILGHSYNGIFQKFIILSEKDIRSGVLVKTHLNKLILGTLVEPLATAIYGFSLITNKVKPKTIAIIGVGPIGLINFLYAKTNICSQVILINKSKDKLNWVEKNKLSAKTNLITNSPKLALKIMKLTGNRGVDAVILCVPRSDGVKELNKVIDYIKPKGIINLVGGVSDQDNIKGSNFDLNSIRKTNVCGNPNRGAYKKIVINKKPIWLTGHRGTSKKHLKSAIKELEKNPQTYSKIITHIFSPQQAVKALNTLSNKKTRKINNQLYIKGVIKFNP